MSFVSSSFEDFLEAFKKRHPKDYGLDSGRFVAVKAPIQSGRKKGACPRFRSNGGGCRR